MAARKKKTATKRRATRKRTTRRVLAKRHPATKRPRRAAPRARFGVGDDVKLIFEGDRPLPGGLAGERMWVRVTRISGQRAYGWLNDEPLVLRGIRHRSRVSFHVRQPIEVIRNA